MKKRNLKSKLIISKKTVSNLDAAATKGGIGITTECPSFDCTFDDDCFSKGPGCTFWQVC